LFNGGRKCVLIMFWDSNDNDIKITLVHLQYYVCSSKFWFQFIISVRGQLDITSAKDKANYVRWNIGNWNTNYIHIGQNHCRITETADLFQSSYSVPWILVSVTDVAKNIFRHCFIYIYYLILIGSWFWRLFHLLFCWWLLNMHWHRH